VNARRDAPLRTHTDATNWHESTLPTTVLGIDYLETLTLE